jgi:hypothetical protein
MQMASSAARRRSPVLSTALLGTLLMVFLPGYGAVEVLDAGEPLAIVIPDGATEQERTAASELATYLGRVADAEASIYPEGTQPRGPAIHVGATFLVRARGGEPSELGPEEWVIDASSDDLLLYGGAPRGTLYAVYHFLEEHVGVEWWSPFEETVPRRSRLRVRSGQWRGAPVFGYRDIRWIDGPRPFCARSRINGHFTQLPWSYGGAIEYGPPRQVHNLHVYAPPEEHYDEHPEYYAEIDDAREPEYAQLCLTNRGLRDLVERRLREFIVQAREEAERRGRPVPRLFAISQEDFARPCQCDECSVVARGERSESGPLIDFLNEIADRVRQDHPEILIDTLAYLHTLRPPRRLTPRDNIVVRVSGLQYRDYARSILHPNNTVYREALLGWARITKNLRVWDYTVTFGPDGELPLPTLGYLAEDLRFYAEAGVEGLFIQHEFPIGADLRDLELWVMARLLEDPGQSTERLIRRFTDGFYGAAGRHVRRYLRLVDRAVDRATCRIRFVASAKDYCYLDRSFVLRASRVFDRAERAVLANPVLLRRLRHARLGLDRAVLTRWPVLLRQWHDGNREGRPFPLDVEAVAARYRQTWTEQVALRVPADRPAEARRILEGVEQELEELEERRSAASVDTGPGAS